MLAFKVEGATWMNSANRISLEVILYRVPGKRLGQPTPRCQLSDYGLQGNHRVLFLAAKFMEIYYTKSRNPIHMETHLVKII